MRLLGSARASEAALFAWAAALPLHPWPLSPVARLGLGEWLAPVGLVTTAALVVRATPSTRRSARAGLLPLVAIVLGFAPSVVFALDVRDAAVQLVVIGYVTTIFLIAHASTVCSERCGRALLGGLVLGALVRAGWGWVAPLKEPWLAGGWPRPIGVAESPNMIALQTCAGAVAALYVRRSVRSTRLRFALAMCAMLLFVTAAATLGHVFLAALVAAAFALWRKWRPIHRAAARGAAVATLAAVLLLVCSARTRLLPLGASPPFVDTRPDLYAAAHEIAIETFCDRPLTGVGLENFVHAWRARDDGRRFASYVPEGRSYVPGTPIDPHSTWLGYLAECGVFGGATLVALVVLGVRLARSRDDRLLDLALAFAAATACIADVLTSRELALLVGVLAAGPSSRRPDRVGTSDRHSVAHVPS